MLPSPIRSAAEHWIAVLRPDQLALFRPAQGVKRFQIPSTLIQRFFGQTATDSKQTAQEELVLLPETASPSHPWHAVVTALGDWLTRTTAAQRTRSVHCVLSSHFCRFGLMPWPNTSLTANEERVLARLSLENNYGSMDGWRIQLASKPSYGQSRFVVAIEDALILAIEAACQFDGNTPTGFSVFNRWRIPSAARSLIHCSVIEPYFMRAYNRWASELKTPDGIFAVLEPGIHAEGNWVVVATFRQGQWHSIRSFKHSHESIATLLQREAILQGFSVVPQLWVHQVGNPSGGNDLGVMTDQGQLIRLIHQKSASDHTPAALAMARVSAETTG